MGHSDAAVLLELAVTLTCRKIKASRANRGLKGKYHVSFDPFPLLDI